MKRRKQMPDTGAGKREGVRRPGAQSCLVLFLPGSPAPGAGSFNTLRFLTDGSASFFKGRR